VWKTLIGDRLKYVMEELVIDFNLATYQGNDEYQ
jgi:hypothetical protein